MIGDLAVGAKGCVPSFESSTPGFLSDVAPEERPHRIEAVQRDSFDGVDVEFAVSYGGGGCDARIVPVLRRICNGDEKDAVKFGLGTCAIDLNVERDEPAVFLSCNTDVIHQPSTFALIEYVGYVGIESDSRHIE